MTAATSLGIALVGRHSKCRVIVVAAATVATTHTRIYIDIDVHAIPLIKGSVCFRSSERQARFCCVNVIEELLLRTSLTAGRWIGSGEKRVVV